MVGNDSAGYLPPGIPPRPQAAVNRDHSDGQTIIAWLTHGVCAIRWG
ncbi:hypothetical protein HMPREF0758_2411 [Serratia odorifera DSM 4582]|uniref:Uncharacterized protein n=1 Tax=Serratia odorifera DSM 4582 TaxID=667129 RepID=D4E2L1_SEROD|nr:hypothetical protein HMPREF0758_2411 [Serratia odorifera DSM 4582]